MVQGGNVEHQRTSQRAKMQGASAYLVVRTSRAGRKGEKGARG